MTTRSKAERTYWDNLILWSEQTKVPINAILNNTFQRGKDGKYRNTSQFAVSQAQAGLGVRKQPYYDTPIGKLQTEELYQRFLNNKDEYRKLLRRLR